MQWDGQKQRTFTEIARRAQIVDEEEDCFETALGGVVVVVRAEELTLLFLAERSQLLLVKLGQAEGQQGVCYQVFLALQPAAERLEAARVLMHSCYGQCFFADAVQEGMPLPLRLLEGVGKKEAHLDDREAAA